jgi:hypothetical protein
MSRLKKNHRIPMDRTLTPEDTPEKDHPVRHRSPKRIQYPGVQIKKQTSPEKNSAATPFTKPECILIDGKGSCTEWEGLLVHYPMIDSIQREDFPDHGASFVYLAHFYHTCKTAEESSRAQKEFEDFFRAIGYTYTYSGNFESRWFEGIGVHTG